MDQQTRTGRGRRLALTIVLGIALAAGIVGMMVANADGIRDVRDQVSGAPS